MFIRFNKIVMLGRFCNIFVVNLFSFIRFYLNWLIFKYVGEKWII